MNDLEKAIENLKFEHSLSVGQRAIKAVFTGIVGLMAAAAAGDAFNRSVKAIRNRNTTV